jgi:hypothetical protein
MKVNQTNSRPSHAYGRDTSRSPVARTTRNPRRIMERAKSFPSMLFSICVTLLAPTHVRRWQKVARDPEPVWDERNRIIADFIAAGSTVLDVGCGAQSLKKHLKAGCEYQPCDLIKSTPDVIVCDFNAGIFPEITTTFDYVVCSGVFEYMREPRKFLELVPTFGKVTLMSYHPFIRQGSKWQRLAANWVNHFSEEELLRLFDAVSLKWQILHGVDTFERIYRLERR